MRPSTDASPFLIGRYRIEKVLGQGGFGIVYLALDEQLDRKVAVKVPHPGTIAKPSIAASYFREAQMVAALDHPAIVPVYDVGTTEQYPCFIVSKYIRGRALSTQLRESRLSSNQSVDLVAKIADALHYAHGEGLIHRDVKPGNILIDDREKPWLVDFGLALREDAPHQGKRNAGTAAYMSPEQARGEGHRIDARSDVFSLGIVLFELLAGRRPFQGECNADYKEKIIDTDAPSLLQIDDSLPAELDRICLKALARRTRDRFNSAHEFGDELRRFLSDSAEIAPPAPISDPVVPKGKTADAPTLSSGLGLRTQSGGRSMTLSDHASFVRIVPKGLRSFDSEDSNFFLELIPGPRDRFGLPEPIRFWKHRISEIDSAKTFNVGLIYGPSGCGKSSLVKAGLLPVLPADVRVAFIEATASDTEFRLQSQLRRHTPDFDFELGLKETLAAIRRGRGLAADKKLLIVIDQFEQWLHGHPNPERTALVEALRECDGSRVQCILMVRDEFWLSVSRFMQELEIPLIEGQNCALVDLFDERHARKVLTAFGIAYEQLPETGIHRTQEQQAFIRKAVDGLSVDERVICVRLSLFAEMMKDKPWTPQSLAWVGGARGAGEYYLDETFCSPNAPARYRQHEIAARSVLRSLLSNTASDLKGSMRSRAELLESSGYSTRDHEFEDLIRVLDGELRLITPIVTEDDSKHLANAADPVPTYYQLTHDYLVHSIRQWLTRKQRETHRGRAELQLEERTALWNRCAEKRQLPSLYEFLCIQCLTQANRWSSDERRLMAAARRHHVVNKLCWLALLLVASLVTWKVISTNLSQSRKTQQEAREAQQKDKDRTTNNEALELVQELRGATITDVPVIASQLASRSPISEQVVRKAYGNAPNGSKEKRFLAYALSAISPDESNLVLEQLDGIPLEETDVLLELLSPNADKIRPLLWDLVESPAPDCRAVLAASSCLAMIDADDQRWPVLAERVAECMAKTETPFGYVSHFENVSEQIEPPLSAIFQNESRPHDQRRHSAVALCGILSLDAQIKAGLPDTFIDWILSSNNKREVNAL